MTDEASKLGARAAGMARAAASWLRGETGILSRIAGEHEEVLALTERTALAEELEDRRDLFAEVRAKLLKLAAAKERAFYPALRVQPNLESLVDRSQDQHGRLRRKLDELAASDPASESWKRTFGLLQADVDRQFRLEEDELFPLVREHFDVDARARLLERYEEAQGSTG